MSLPVIADTGGLLRALAHNAHGRPSFPDYEAALTSASLVIVLGLVLAEVDYFLRENRAAMRKLVAEIFDPGTRYEYELPLPSDIARALELDAKFKDLNLGLRRWHGRGAGRAAASVPGSDNGRSPFFRHPDWSTIRARARNRTVNNTAMLREPFATAI